MAEYNHHGRTVVLVMRILLGSMGYHEVVVLIMRMAVVRTATTTTTKARIFLFFLPHNHQFQRKRTTQQSVIPFKQ